MKSAGAVYALLAYVAWGISPIFWRELSHLPTSFVMGQRVLWAGAIFLGLLFWRGRTGELWQAMRTKAALIILASAALLATNWFIYLYAVNTDRVLDASLGYFINPLVNIVLGMLFLGERLRRNQWLAVALAAIGVALLAANTAGTPWISLSLAGSFGIYGLLRKTVRHDALLGSNMEMLFLVPGALLILFAPSQFSSQPSLDNYERLLIFGTGVQTALPLLWFSNAARRLPLSTLGFFQYLAPSLQFLLAVFLFKEPFGWSQLVCFALIWIALALLTIDAQVWRRRQRLKEPAPLSA